MLIAPKKNLKTKTLWWQNSMASFVCKKIDKLRDVYCHQEKWFYTLLFKRGVTSQIEGALFTRSIRLHRPVNEDALMYALCDAK